MFGRIASIAAALGASLGLAPTSLQDSVRQIAIIGAGPAGSSAAYHLHKYAEAASITLNITLFEKEDHIGGRTLTVPAYGDGEPIELGASIFIKDNQIMYNASQEFGLGVKASASGEDDGVLGIWDGYDFVFTIKNSDSWWWNTAKLFWRYGVAPYRAQKLMEGTVKAFLKIYESPYVPFKSLTEVATDLGLTRTTGATGEQLLELHKVGENYARDIVQASTRVTYASNLAHIHGLDTMVAIATKGSRQIEGGNWQIFDQMVKKSGAHAQLETAVSSISRRIKRDESVSYTLKVKSGEAAETYPITFNDLIIATPFQYANIDIEGSILGQPIDIVPILNMAPGSKVPSTVLTTLTKEEDPAIFPEGAGKPGFYSISILRNITNPTTGKLEYVYKIFSPKPVTPAFMSALLGAKVPETFSGTHPEEDEDHDGETPISWFYPHVFHAYPIALPRVTFEDPVLARGLYYTSGMESLISTMETNALAGMNIARLIVDELVEEQNNKKGQGQGRPVPTVEGRQKVLGEDIPS